MLAALRRQWDVAPIAAARRRGTDTALGAVLLVGIALAAVTVGPHVLPYQVLPVLGGSMGAALPAGSLAVIVPASAAELRVGDVITFRHPARAGEYITHRIVAIVEGGRSFVTKGDANAVPDPWAVVGSADGWRLAAAVPEVGRWLVLLEMSRIGPLLVAVSAAGLALVALLSLWRPMHRRERVLIPAHAATR